MEIIYIISLLRQYAVVTSARAVTMNSKPLLAVSAKEASSRFGFYTDEAMLRPVGIQRHGTTRVVMISLDEYERLKRRDRQVIRTEDLDEHTIEAILSAEPGERSREAGRRLADPDAG
jgi:PHD/YefM family antitoxin component YafN of YafNO toxin-antitoxin module